MNTLSPSTSSGQAIPAARRLLQGNLPVRLLPGLLCLAAFLSAAWAWESGNREMPVARNGVLDLSGWDLEQDGPLRLDGEWEIYRDKLLTPGYFTAAAAVAPPDIYVMPGSWNSLDLGANATDGTGFATLRLRVLPGQEPVQAALRLFNIYSAYALWADGRLLAQSGVVGTSARAELAEPSMQLAGLELDGRPVELVLQISNFHYRDGGPLSSLEMGPEDAMHRKERRTAGTALFVIGAFLVMGLYHVVLFTFRKQNTSPLHFALYCFAWMSFYITSDFSGWSIRLFLPQLSPRLLEHIALASFFVSIPIGLLFFRSLYPQEFSRTAIRASAGLAAVFVLLACTASTLTLTTWVPVYFAASALAILYSAFRLFRAWRRKRDGSAVIFLGFLALGLSGMGDMLADLKFIHGGPFLPAGMLTFILFQAMALSQRFSKAFSAVETLSVQLEDKNLHLETEMAERSRLEREIVNISEDERRRISQDLHDGLCQQLTGARLRCAALTRLDADADADGGSQPLEQLSSMLDELVDQAYNLSCGLWPLEHSPSQSGPSLASLAQRFSRSSGIPVDFHQTLACETCLNPRVVQMHRIAQEALANAVKHANPTRISVSFACSDGRTAMLSVRDDGVGMGNAGPSRGGLGTSIMAHRARLIDGTLTFDSAPGTGTVVTCTAPCDSDRQDSPHKAMP